MNLIYQGFSIGSNVWLSEWSDASTAAVNGTLSSGDRDMYLGVYGALGLGQGKSNFFFKVQIIVVLFSQVNKKSYFFVC